MKKRMFLFLFLITSMLSYGAVITVSTTADNVPGSLRAAIDQANGNGQENVIYLPAGTYLLAGGMNDDQNAHGDLDLFPAAPLTIIGESAGTTIIDANQSDRVLHVISGTVSISHVTIKGGSTEGHRFADPAPHGGGIYNAGTLSLTSCRVIQNITGPIQTLGHSGGGAGQGGGIYNTGTLNAHLCTIRDNRGGAGGRGLVSGSDGGSGGGVMNTGTVTMSRCIIDLNGAGNGTEPQGNGGGGGGICSSGTLNLDRCTVAANSSGNGGGDSGTWGTRGGNGGGIYITEGTANVDHCTFYENTTGDGGIRYNNQRGAAGLGGAIALDRGSVWVKSCTITGNSTGEGEQPDELAPGSGHGGGLYNRIGAIIFVNTIVAGNIATSPGKGNDCYGDYWISGPLLIQDGDGWTLDGDDFSGLITGSDPLLGFPADNGGPTPTCALAQGSPAIDTGSTTSYTDQRGYVRTNPDIGAYEYNAQAGPVLRATPDIINLAADGSGNQTTRTVLFIDNGGGGSLNWEIRDLPSWLTCSPLSAGGATQVALTADTTGLTPGTYSGEIEIHCDEASNSPLKVRVALVVQETGSGSAPFGFFDTPLDNATVMSSVPFTGWALDDIGIRDVKIYRNSVNGESGDWVYVGDATLVEGARPDIEARYPAYPNRSRAGWGYMMLTNFLPGQGNGQFTFQVRATDVEGHTTILGVKTVTIDNKNAIKPFGAIDTPREGGAASGGYFVNFGWALTPLPNTIPMDGSTITVWVDGKAVGHPVYNQYRQDIATLFPGYDNSNGAVGYFYLDTTAYENGVHTIAWSVRDDAGNSDGIGSRYFSIQNGGVSQSAGASQKAAQKTGPRALPDVHAAVYTCNEKITHIQTNECEAFELRLKTNSLYNSYTWSGYMKKGDSYAPLPTGSTLDIEEGVFYCLLGPGFIGNYQLVFFPRDKQGHELKDKGKEVIITVLPKHQNQEKKHGKRQLTGNR